MDGVGETNRGVTSAKRVNLLSFKNDMHSKRDINDEPLATPFPPSPPSPLCLTYYSNKLHESQHSMRAYLGVVLNRGVGVGTGVGVALRATCKKLKSALACVKQTMPQTLTQPKRHYTVATICQWLPYSFTTSPPPPSHSIPFSVPLHFDTLQQRSVALSSTFSIFFCRVATLLFSVFYCGIERGRLGEGKG